MTRVNQLARPLTLTILVALTLLAGCQTAPPSAPPLTFGQEQAFLASHNVPLVVLKDPQAQAQVLIAPQLQGRVLTSTAGGPQGDSFGWVNCDYIVSGKNSPQFNPFGGEDRLWLGPEGGQFGLYFPPGAPFAIDRWFTPAALNEEPWELAEQSDTHAVVQKTMQVTNHSGTVFDVAIDRRIELLDHAKIRQLLGVDLSGPVKAVAYQSVNTMTNTGEQPWNKDSGLLSIWILGMYKHSPRTTVVVPFQQGPDDQLGPVVNDAYFGTLPTDRLAINDGFVYFRADGQRRSKIGLSYQRAKNRLGSYDPTRSLLTVVQYNKPVQPEPYVNSMWQLQKEPYAGDVVNAYNDGPLANGDILGPFYELESSSPAAALAPGTSIRHVHQTFHFQGPLPLLDKIAQATLGVGLQQIENALP